MRTNIRDPVLALTASVTLRDAPVKQGHKRGNFSIDTISTRTGGEDFEEEEGDYGGDGLARLNQFDLLGGLVDGTCALHCRVNQILPFRLDWSTRGSTRSEDEAGPLPS